VDILSRISSVRSALAKAVGGAMTSPVSVLRRRVRPLAAVAAAAIVLLAVQETGFVSTANSNLEIMGFDPDRAQLISSALVCAAAGAVAYLVSASFSASVVLGLASGTLIYVPTFGQETSSALASSGAAGVFDPGGWVLTLETLVLTGVVVSWAATTLSVPVRRRLAAAGRGLVDAIRQRRIKTRALVGPAMVAVVVALLVVSVPTLGDMLNYTPDTHMLAGAPQGPALAGGSGSSPSPGSSPWLAWKPSGSGQVDTAELPAPWVGGQTVPITVYLPPGYGASPQRRYPVVYEAVFAFAAMDKAFNAKSEIDALIDDGQTPASIVVFIETSGGPYKDSECANSVDGQEWMASFIAETVPQYVDGHYRTIANKAARTVLGFSQGGYCAAILALDYPAVFGNEVSFSGYFQAGLAAANANAWRPFGHSQAVLDQYSPALVAPQLPASTRMGLYFVLDYDPAQQFYGPQAEAFIAVLRSAGIRYAALAAPQKHSWTEVRDGLGPALALVGAREAAEHVFG
jgi:S-formylglutathione hydrolase FrmB